MKLNEIAKRFWHEHHEQVAPFFWLLVVGVGSLIITFILFTAWWVLALIVLFVLIFLGLGWYQVEVKGEN